jgi:hypothetical protein
MADPVEIPRDLYQWLDQQAILRGLPISTVLLGILYEARNSDEAAKIEAARVNRPADIWSGIEREARDGRR